MTAYQRWVAWLDDLAARFESDRALATAIGVHHNMIIEWRKTGLPSVTREPILADVSGQSEAAIHKMLDAARVERARENWTAQASRAARRRPRPLPGSGSATLPVPVDPEPLRVEAARPITRTTRAPSIRRARDVTSRRHWVLCPLAQLDLWEDAA